MRLLSTTKITNEASKHKNNAKEAAKLETMANVAAKPENDGK